MKGDSVKQFIQIGNEFLNTSDIIRVEIDGSYVVMYIRQIQAGEAEIVSGSDNKRLCWSLSSQEGQALLTWLKDRTEVLAPYSEE